MKKLSFENFFWLIPVFVIFAFFLPKILIGKIPIPADSILGLYHPWRDQAISGYSPAKFPTKNPLITDPVLQTYPWREIVINNLRNLQFPLWNPYSFSGQPLLGNIQSSPFQLLNILFFMFTFNLAWGFQIILPTILTGLFMYFFLKSLKLSQTASIFGSIILPFTGFFVAWQTWGNIITTAMWLPLILLAIKKTYEKGSALWFPLLVFSLSQTIFSGHWQTALYVYFAAFIYVIFQQIESKKLKPLILITAAGLATLFISTPQIAPSLDFISKSARELDQSFTPGRKDWFLPFQNLIQVIVPDFFGNPTTYNYWGVWNYAEFVSFIGIIPAFLVIISLFSYSNKNNYFIFIGAIALLIALQNPISLIPYTYKFPFLDSIQPSRIIFLLVFVLSSLAAFGLEDFINSKSKKKILASAGILGVILFSLFLVVRFDKSIFPSVNNIDAPYTAFHNLIFPIAIFISLVGITFLFFAKVNKIIIIALIFLITIFDLFRFSYKFTPFSKLSEIFPPTPITSYLQSQNKPFRVLATDRRIINGNSTTPYKIETVQGYDPIYLKSYADLVSVWNAGQLTQTASFNRIVTPQNYNSQIADLLDVKYVLTFDEISDSSYKKIMTTGSTNLYENTKSFPRAFFPSKIVKTQNDQDILSNMLNSQVDLKKTAFSKVIEYNATDLKGEAQFINYSDQNFSIKTTTNKETPMVVSNIYYPGWEANIDGQKTEINQVDYTLQMVMVPSGTHIINFIFKPKLFYNSLYVSLIGLIMTLTISVYLWKKPLQ